MKPFQRYYIIVFFKVAYATDENQQILLHPSPSQIKECQK